MHNLKTLALLAALSTASAFAVNSTPNGYSAATLTPTASGTYASAVSFSVPTATLTIPSNQVRPGASFTITLPVTNTTDRSVTITSGTVTKPTNATVLVTGDNVTLAAGATSNLVYTITFAADGAGAETLAGTTASFSFPVNANDTAATPAQQTF